MRKNYEKPTLSATPFLKTDVLRTDGSQNIPYTPFEPELPIMPLSTGYSRSMIKLAANLEWFHR